MQPCGHTQLMNALIGMCKPNVNWVSVLAEHDLNYNIQVIEQSISTTSGQVVKPDLVTASNRQLHSIVFEVKGGKSINADQIDRYSGLTANDLLRWVTVFDRAHLEFDICICDFEENHPQIKSMNNNRFPMLVFGSESLVKEGTFKRSKLNESFANPISLKGKVQPLSYYPFSDEDTIPYIALHVIQALLSIVHKGTKQGMPISEEALFTFDDVLAEKFSYIWKVLSIEHRKALRLKIIDVTKSFLARPDVKESLGLMQQKEGYRITKNLDQFKKIAEKFVEELQTQTPLSEFWRL